MLQQVWVIDDQQDILDIIQIYLEGEGYQVKTYLNGSFLQQKIDNWPDMFLLDILLMGEDGRDICRELKSRENTHHIPVILLSAHFNARNALAECGADDFLAKPFHLDELANTVKSHLNPGL